MKLASTELWSQVWTDGTTHRQIPFNALVIRSLGDIGTVDTLIIVHFCGGLMIGNAGRLETMRMFV